MDRLEIILSEEHIDRWLRGRAPGATITVSKLSELAHAWWVTVSHPTGVPTPGSRTRPSSAVSD